MNYISLLPISKILSEDIIIGNLNTYDHDEYHTFRANVFGIINKNNKPIEVPNIDVRQWYIIYQVISNSDDICWPHDSKNNSSAFSYEYFMYNCCLLLDQLKYIPYFPSPIKNDKLRKQDAIWKQICKHLKWTYKT